MSPMENTDTAYFNHMVIQLFNNFAADKHGIRVVTTKKIEEIVFVTLRKRPIWVFKICSKTILLLVIF